MSFQVIKLCIILTSITSPVLYCSMTESSSSSNTPLAGNPKKRIREFDEIELQTKKRSNCLTRSEAIALHESFITSKTNDFLVAFDNDDHTLMSDLLRQEKELSDAIEHRNSFRSQLANIKYYETAPLLHIVAASQEDPLNLMGLLIDHGAHVNAIASDDVRFPHEKSLPCCKLTTALHEVCRRSPLKINRIKQLIEAGAHVNSRDQSGDTPMHKLFQTHNDGLETTTQATFLLLQAGARTSTKNNENKTAHDIFLQKYAHQFNLLSSLTAPQKAEISEKR